MHANEWISLITLGFMLGVLGQLLRSLAGWHKLKEKAREGEGGESEAFNWTFFCISLLIGGVAGALGAYLIADETKAGLSSQQVLGLMAAGYTGSDFITGFLARFPSVATRAYAPVQVTPGGMTLTKLPTPGPHLGAEVTIERPSNS